MELAYRKYGEGHPFLILHGLYGTSDNWVSIARHLSDFFEVFTIDLRNHGRSPHSPEHNYDVMANDIATFMQHHKLMKAVILGHSMGGKVAMYFAHKYPEKVSRLIVADISPRSYMQNPELHPQFEQHKTILSALKNAPLSQFSKREEVDSYLESMIPDMRIRQFLMKNLHRDGHSFRWILNIEALENNLERILDGLIRDYNNPEIKEPVTEFPVLFLKGENSGYISDIDLKIIHKLYPYAEIVTLFDAGHWLHAEQPENFLKAITGFIFNR